MSARTYNKFLLFLSQPCQEKQNSIALPPSHHPVHFADEETEARKLDEVPRRVFPRRTTCPFPWKGDSASPASAIPEPARAMHRPPHAAPAVAAMLAATGDGGARDLAGTSTFPRVPCLLPWPAIRSASRFPTPCPTAIVLPCPRPS